MNTQKLKPKSFKIQDSHQTLMSLTMIEDTTQMAEECITAIKAKQQELVEPLDKAKHEVEEAESILQEAQSNYLNLKSQYDKHEEAIKTKQNTITLLNHIRTGKSMKTVTVFKTISNNVGHKDKTVGKRKMFNLRQIAVDALTKRNEFLAPKELFAEMRRIDPELEAKFKDVRPSHAHITTLVSNLVKSAQLLKKIHGPSKLTCFYEGKIGLPNWLTDDGSLQTPYITQFIGTESSVDLNSRFNRHNAPVLSAVI